MACDIQALDRLVHDRVVGRYDHRHLNLDVEDFVEHIPTGENIVRRIWELLDGSVPKGRLNKVRLVETRDNAFEYVGEEA